MMGQFPTNVLLWMDMMGSNLVAMWLKFGR